MADLSDFLGHILEEITRARGQADVESVRIAKMYAADPDGLLKRFPVPRMRLQNVEINAPMIVSFVPEGHVEQANPDVLSQTIASDLITLLAKEKITIGIAKIIKIINADPSLSKGYVTSSAADTLSAQINSLIEARDSEARDSKDASPPDTHTEVVSLIRDQIKKTLQSLPRKPVGIRIDATTSVVREFNKNGVPGANVLFVKMSISEEALEIEFRQPTEPLPPGQPPPPPVIERLSPE